jgi:ATP adenylyltransferase
MRFIRKSARETGCLFCRLREPGDDRARHVLLRLEHALLMLNRYPYNPGHLMVAVRRHTGSVASLRDEERRDFLQLVGMAEQALELAYRPHGMNHGANVGHVAGAGYAGHFHWHLVPRWSGDTNFMPTVGQARVLPESLDQSYRRLKAALKRLGAGAPRGGTRRGRSRRRA